MAYGPTRAEVSGHYHRNLRVLFEQHDSKVVDAMAQFAGSVGTYEDEAMFSRLVEALGVIGCRVFKPDIPDVS